MKMKSIIWVQIIGLLLTLVLGCDKEKTITLPVITTAEVSNISQINATCGGSISSDGGAPVTAKGTCWSTSQTPTISDSKTEDGTGTKSFTSTVTGLIPNVTYNLRAFATNSAGTSYGDVVSFTTLSNVTVFNPFLTYGTVTDIDNNVYKTITIGDQTWMAENLKVTRYRNGDSIPEITDKTLWINQTTGACCSYDNEIGNSIIYGKLYNFYTILDSRNLCPNGWHVPTYKEWEKLIYFLGGFDTAGGMMKETGTTHWQSPNVGATNESGFTALPAGIRIEGGTFQESKKQNYYWSSTWYSQTNIAYYFALHEETNKIFTLGYYLTAGLSVRCVKD